MRSAAAATWDALGARPYNASWCAPSLFPIRDLLPGMSCARRLLRARPPRECCDTDHHLMIVPQAR